MAVNKTKKPCLHGVYSRVVEWTENKDFLQRGAISVRGNIDNRHGGTLLCDGHRRLASLTNIWPEH